MSAKRTMNAASNGTLLPYPYTMTCAGRKWTVYRNGRKLQTFGGRLVAVRFVREHLLAYPIEPVADTTEDVDEEILERLRQHRREAQGV